MDKNTNIKDLETLLQESRVEEEIQAILEELDTNDAPDAIEDGQPEEIDADASRESYMSDEDEGDDVEEIVVESLSDEELVALLFECYSDEEILDILDEAGYEISDTTLDVLQESEILDEGLRAGIIDTMNRSKFLRHFVGAKAQGRHLARVAATRARKQAAGIDTSKEDEMLDRSHKAISHMWRAKNQEKAGDAAAEQSKKITDKLNSKKNAEIQKLNAQQKARTAVNDIATAQDDYTTTAQNIKATNAKNSTIKTPKTYDSTKGKVLKKEDGKFVAESYNIMEGDLIRNGSQDLIKENEKLKKNEEELLKTNETISTLEKKRDTKLAKKRLSAKKRSAIENKYDGENGLITIQRNKRSEVENAIAGSKAKKRDYERMNPTAWGENSELTDYDLMKLLEISQYEASVENLLLLKEDEDLLLALYEEVVEGNPEEREAKEEGFEDGHVEEHEHVYEDGVCKVCGEPEKKEEENKEETTKPIEESFNNIFGILTEEYGMNDAPKAIKSVSSTKMAGKATKNDYMYDEEQADDVEEILIESLSDYEIMQALVECGIEPTIENVMIIREEAEEKEKTKEEQAYEKGQKDYQHDIDLEKAAKKKRRKEIASAVGKIALGTALAAGAGWMATKHGAAEAEGISNLKADVEAKDAKVNDAQAKVDNAEDIAKNDKLDGSVEAKTLDNLDNAHEDLTNAKNAAEVAKSNLRKAQALATTKQAAKVGVTAGGAAVLATSAAKDIKGRKSNPEVDKKQEEMKAKDALEKENKNKIKEQIKEVKKEIADLKKKIKNEKDPGEASKLNKQLDRKQKQKEDLEKKLTKNEAYNNFNLDSRDVFVEQVSLTIASENNDRLFTEMVNATILANRLRKELLEKYADVSETRVNSILEELGMNDSPSVMKQGTSDDVDDEFDYDDYMTDEVNGNDVVVEAYIPTETVFEMLEKYGFGATEYNVEFLREELEVNDAPVAIKIKHAEEIQAKIARADYFPDETFSDDVKEVLVESGMGDMSNEAITESIVNTALNTIREIIKSHC